MALFTLRFASLQVVERLSVRRRCACGVYSVVEARVYGVAWGAVPVRQGGGGVPGWFCRGSRRFSALVLFYRFLASPSSHGVLSLLPSPLRGLLRRVGPTGRGLFRGLVYLFRLVL